MFDRCILPSTRRTADADPAVSGRAVGGAASLRPGATPFSTGDVSGAGEGDFRSGDGSSARGGESRFGERFLVAEIVVGVDLASVPPPRLGSRAFVMGGA